MLAAPRRAALKANSFPRIAVCAAISPGEGDAVPLKEQSSGRRSRNLSAATARAPGQSP